MLEPLGSFWPLTTSDDLQKRPKQSKRVSTDFPCQDQSNASNSMFLQCLVPEPRLKRQYFENVYFLSGLLWEFTFIIVGGRGGILKKIFYLMKTQKETG